MPSPAVAPRMNEPSGRSTPRRIWWLRAFLYLILCVLLLAAASVWRAGRQQVSDVFAAQEFAAKAKADADRAQSLVADAEKKVAASNAAAAAAREAATKAEKVLEAILQTAADQEERRARESDEPPLKVSTIPPGKDGYFLAAFCDSSGLIIGRNVARSDRVPLKRVDDLFVSPDKAQGEKKGVWLRTLVAMRIRERLPTADEAARSDFPPAIGLIKAWGEEIQLESYDRIPFRDIEEVWVRFKVSSKRNAAK